MLAKIDVWFSRRKVQKAMAKISPRYLARSPVNIRSSSGLPPNSEPEPYSEGFSPFSKVRFTCGLESLNMIPPSVVLKQMVRSLAIALRLRPRQHRLPDVIRHVRRPT